MEHRRETADSTTTKLHESNDNDGADTKLSGNDVELSKTDKPMAGQETSTDTKRGISQFDKDEVVQLEDGQNFEKIKKIGETKFKREDIEHKQSEVNNFVQKSLEDSDFNDIIEIDVSNNAIKKLKEFTNMNFQGYKESQYVRHARRGHKEDIKFFDEYVDMIENFDFARKSTTRNRRNGKTEVSVELYKKAEDGVYKVVQLRNFDDKTLEFRTMFKIDEADQNLPQDLRLWSDAEFRKNSPLTERPNTESDGFIDDSVSKTTDKSQEIYKREEVNQDIQKNIKSWDDIANNIIRSTHNFFHGLDKNGNIKENTNKIFDFGRKHLVVDAFKRTDLAELIRNNKQEKTQIKLQAKQLQESLGKLTNEDSELLVLALDGDIPKDKIKETFGDDKLHSIYTTNGAFAGEPANLEQIKKNYNLKIEVGGGTRDEETIKMYIELGIGRLILGSIAVKDLHFVKNMASKYPIVLNSWNSKWENLSYYFKYPKRDKKDYVHYKYY